MMSTNPPPETHAEPAPRKPVAEPPVVEAPVASQDRMSPALMVGVFIILLLCVALALVAYQGA